MPRNYFSAYELRCRCDRPECDADPICIGLLMKANMLRSLYGKPINLISARRCKYHNENIEPKGAKFSQHLYGKAIDIAEYDRSEQDKLVELAEKVGFGGIFKYDWGIHVDDGPRNRRGNYRSKK